MDRDRGNVTDKRVCDRLVCGSIGRRSLSSPASLDVDIVGLGILTQVWDF